MATSREKWWQTWAPYWQEIEDRHLGVFLTEKLLDDMESPVLVIGAGQGLIVDYLKKKGLVADGIDLEKEMIVQARNRRSIALIQADAAALPLDSGYYQTVIIATGVVDYMSEAAAIGTILREAFRVLRPHGVLLVSFYQLKPKTEKIYKKIGIITPDNNYHLGRLFEILQLRKASPLRCIKPIAQWTNRGFLPTLLTWTRVGLTVPRELVKEDEKIDRIVALAKKDNIDESQFFGDVPARIPYRKEAELAALFDEVGIDYCETVHSEDCTVVKCYKTSFHAMGFKETFKRSVNGRLSERKLSDSVIINTQNLTKRYAGSKVKAVDDLSLSIPEGTIYGILGPNGAGKTTTLSMLCGLMKPDAGEIRFAGGFGARELRKYMGYVPQDLALYPKLSGRHNLSFFGRMYDVDGDTLKKKIHELLVMVGLEERADDLVMTYSTGMMRRLNLAIGLLHEPKILLLDEPTVGIDPQSRNCIFESVLRLRQMGVTMLYTTHYMEEASKLCDVVAIMDHGKIVVEGNPKELVDSYGLYRIDIALASYEEGFLEGLMKDDGVLNVLKTDHGITIVAKSDNGGLDVIDNIKEMAKKHGVQMSLKNIREPNLESLFLDITGRNLRDHSSWYQEQEG
ncbi:MAG: ATP-binding cassette domain-containing protein [Proteobacteria bacterium]|nr:ATP-binding cassette domain-containing protein [Pseudomonadota bacterium]